MATENLIFVVLLAAATFYGISYLTNLKYELEIMLNTHVEDEITQENLFHFWMYKYQKEYSTYQQKQERYEIWQENYKYIKEFNSNGTYTFTIGLNKFADFTIEEFKGTIFNRILNQSF